MSNEIEKETPPEAASSKASKPSVSETRARTKRAWRMLGIYLLIEILFKVWSEWQAAHSMVNTTMYGAFLLILIPFCFISFIKMVRKRAFVAALIYAFILIISHESHRMFPFEMQMKAYLFSAYPQLCPCHPQPGQHTYVCYEYDFGGEWSPFERLVINPGDELSLPPSYWPEEVKKIVFGTNVNGDAMPDDGLCARKIEHMVNHIYWFTLDCSVRK